MTVCVDFLIAGAFFFALGFIVLNFSERLLRKVRILNDATGENLRKTDDEIWAEDVI